MGIAHYHFFRRRGARSILRLFALFTAFIVLDVALVQRSKQLSSSAVLTERLYTAYVVTLNVKSERFRSTKQILQKLGFRVLTVHPSYVGDSYLDRTLSNKYAFLEVFEAIKSGEDEWGYVFEDDIALNPERVDSDILANIARGETLYGRLFQYLGVCKSTHTAAISMNVSKTCGRCAHAMGISRKGVNKLFEYMSHSSDVVMDSRLTPPTDPYMDAVIESWCLQEGGFHVVGPLQHAKRGDISHIGLFLQDRERFISTIQVV